MISHISEQWVKLVAGLVSVFVLFQLLGHVLGSDRGQAGLAVAAFVVAALVAVECLLFRQSPASALSSLGLGRPGALAVAAAVGLSGLLLLVIPAYAYVRGVPVVPHLGWAWLLPGLFAQAGVAEEALFRGYLFRRLRQGRSFWSAALLSMVPFVVVHLFMFATLPWTIALAAVALATVISLPLAHLFEVGRNTIWPSAILHFTVQGAIKVLELPGDALLPVVWMAASAAIPYLAFFIQRFRAPVSATVATSAQRPLTERR